MEPVRVVHYINQFFGGIGGEDKADVELQVHEKPVGPGIGLQKEFGDRARIVATLVCGDNYINLHMDEARRQILEAVARYQPQVLIAGPAFNAGRYGFACGEICKSIAERFGISAVTAMYPENPGVAVYKTAANVWILPTTDLAASMVKVLPKLASFALKLAQHAPLGPADQDGYIPTGRRKLEVANTPAADRAINMLLAKLRGEPFRSEVPVENFERVPAPSGLKTLHQARLAVITTSGMVPKGNPDEFKMFNATRWSKYTLPEAGALLPDDWEFIHGGYNTAFAQANPNVVFPLDALREYAGDIYGELSPDFYSITGVGTSLTMAQRAGEEIAASMREQRVDAALLVATWGTCTRCGAALTKEIERKGIPVALISAMPQLAQQVGASRVVAGRKIPHPCGDPNLPPELDLKLREDIVGTALHSLEENVTEPRIFVPVSLN